MAMRRLFLMALACMTSVAANPSFAQPGDFGNEVSTIRTIAIVPFTNLTGRSGDEWMGAGIAEALATGFLAGSALVVRETRVLGGRVPERNVTLSSRDSVQAIGQEFGARRVGLAI